MEQTRKLVIVAERLPAGRAGAADGGDLRLLKRGACGDGYAGAVRADNGNNAAAHEILRGGNGRGLVGLVIDLNELDLIFLAVDRHTGNDLVGIARAEHFLHAAGAVLTRGGLKNADLQYVAFNGGPPGIRCCRSQQAERRSCMRKVRSLKSFSWFFSLSGIRIVRMSRTNVFPFQI